MPKKPKPKKPEAMSETMIHVLYDLAVDRQKRHSYFQDAEKYLASFDLSPKERELLIREAETEKKLIEKRKKSKGSLKRKAGKFEKTYGKTFLPSTDDGNGDPDDGKQH